MARGLHAILFTLASLLLGLALLLAPGLRVERDLGLQWLFKLRGPLESPQDVAVVGINSSSGAAMGLSRLPRNWPRSLHAVLLSRLSASDVRTVVFDMDFSEASSPIEDLTFADAVSASGRTVLFERLDGRNERVVSGDSVSRWVWVETSSPPTPPLAAAARAYAPFPLPKVDQASHQFWSFKPSADDAPTAAAVAAQLALLSHHEAWRSLVERAGVRSSLLPVEAALEPPGALTAYMKEMRKLFLGQPLLMDDVLRLARSSELTPEDRRAVEALAKLYGGPDVRYTNFYGPPGTLETYPYQALRAVDDLGLATLPDQVAPNDVSRRLAGRTVFVGYSDLYSPDQPDRFYTAFSTDRGIDLSGCEIMATAFVNLLRDEAIEAPPPWVAAAVVAVFGLVVSQLIFWPSAYLGVPLVLLTAGVYLAGALHVFSTAQLWLPVAVPLTAQVPFALGAGLLGQYLLERRRKQRVGAAIAHYLPQHLVQGIVEGRLSSSNINEVVHGVCLATDMAGFSRISERKSPSELARFMNAYFERVAQVLKAHDVDVTEFHADTIMCAWLGKPDDKAIRRRAVLAAVKLVEAIESFADGDEDLGLSARVGLQDGDFYLGHTGGGDRFSYSILGNPANSASRLEGLNKKLGTRVLAAASVVEGLNEVLARPLGKFKVVGKDETVEVVEVAGIAGDSREPGDDLRAAFARALASFSEERWDAAAAAFVALSARFPRDVASRFYLSVCQRYVAEGPPDDQPTRLPMTEK